MFDQAILLLTDAAYAGQRKIEMSREHIKRLRGEEHEMASARLRRYQRDLAELHGALAILEEQRHKLGAHGG